VILALPVESVPGTDKASLARSSRAAAAFCGAGVASSRSSSNSSSESWITRIASLHDGEQRNVSAVVVFVGEAQASLTLLFQCQSEVASRSHETFRGSPSISG
jgi:hypothetical protein